MHYAEYDRYPHQEAAFVPSHGLLMPETRNDAEEGDEYADAAQYGLSVPANASPANDAVLYAVEGVNV